MPVTMAARFPRKNNPPAARVIDIHEGSGRFILEGMARGILHKSRARFLITMSVQDTKSGPYVSIKAVNAARKGAHPIELGHFNAGELELYLVRRTPIFTRRQLEFIKIRAQKVIQEHKRTHA